jgi:hypothetical protein
MTAIPGTSGFGPGSASRAGIKLEQHRRSEQHDRYRAGERDGMGLHERTVVL